MSAKDRLSTPMVHALYRHAMDSDGIVADDPLIDRRTHYALQDRGLVRWTMLIKTAAPVWALTLKGFDFVQQQWPSTPATLGTDVEPEGGWTPREGVGR